MKTAILIKNIRTNIGLTQKEFAKLLGISRESIANYETRTIPPGDILLKIQELEINSPAPGNTTGV